MRGNLMKRLLIVGAMVAVTAWCLSPLWASAWGDGTICWQGQTYSFDDEPTYYEFLGSHPGATEGTCTTTTTTEGTVPPSSTSPEIATTSSSGATTTTSPTTTSSSPETTVAPPSTASSPPSPPSSSAPSETVPVPPGSCLDTGQCQTGEPSSSPPSPSSTDSPSATPTSSPTPSATSTSDSLPATGIRDWAGLLILGALLIAAGAVALLATRDRM